MQKGGSHQRKQNSGFSRGLRIVDSRLPGRQSNHSDDQNSAIIPPGTESPAMANACFKLYFGIADKLMQKMSALLVGIIANRRGQVKAKSGAL